MSKLKPVKIEKEHGTGSIFFGFFVIVLLLGLGSFIYSSNHHNIYVEGGESFHITISNMTKRPYKLSFMDKILEPGKSLNVNLPQHKTIHVYSSPTEIPKKYTLSNTLANKIYITPVGIRTNLSASEDVEFENLSHFPVMFVLDTIKYIVYPMSSSNGHFVPSKSKWKVIHPNDTKILSELRISGKPKKIIFDGRLLKAY